MWIRVLWAGLQAAMWITHVQCKFRHGLLEKSLISPVCVDHVNLWIPAIFQPTLLA